jgi:hypothetical protein
MAAEAEQEVMERAQIGIVVRRNEGAVQGFIGLSITTSTTQYQTYLCDETDFEQVAKQLHDNVLRAGATLRQENRKLVIATDLPDGLKNNASVRSFKKRR